MVPINSYMVRAEESGVLGSLSLAVGEVMVLVHS